MLVMGCAEVGSATWLLVATKLGFPVSTTQTVVGAIVGAGIASQAQVTWRWTDGSVSQVAASWGIAPALSACFSAILFGTLKFCILERENSFEKALRAIPIYLAFTAAVLALFITIEAPNAPSLEELGAGTAVGIILGVFFGVLLIAYIFFLPYFHRVVVKNDVRVRPWHIPLGPLLWREKTPLYFPGKGNSIVLDYYESPHGMDMQDKHASNLNSEPLKEHHNPQETAENTAAPNSSNGDTATASGAQNITGLEELERGNSAALRPCCRVRHVEPEERWLVPVRHLPIYNHQRLANLIKYFLLQGVTRDCVTHTSQALADVHSKAKRYDNRVEHLWTYAQVASAMMMSIAHGSNDVANAVGPWVAVYQTYQTGVVSEDSDTPIWILVVAGFLLGAGFWFMGHHIIKALGNKITQVSPTRGYAMELGAAITVLLASRLGLPVSTTQCLTGAVCGVALMNADLGAVNWRQLAWIIGGWVLTLPSAGLIAGLLTVMALNAPQFS
ncbi:hypothetical protein FNYG_15783 [Fusarium nygamai]|uniref:Phosphate transporter n=1 Tax=Gibberella nygamai TaxID=42673 RepID=A0A2K0U5J5_GIBNY|nr:hypothetical protein FNYG_15783 [Fusarium nygamai]